MQEEQRSRSGERRSDVLIIVPVLNEAEALPSVLGDLRRESPCSDVVVVNDGSTDRTAAVAREAGFRVLDMCFNLGIGGAMQAGFKYAVERGYAIAVQLDGDGQHPADQIDKIVAPVRDSGCDMAIGSRFLEDNGYEGDPWRRRGTRFLSRICTLASGQRITDATSGFRAFGPRALSYFVARYPADYPEPETIVLLSRRGMRVCEVPVEMRARQGGKSSISGIGGVYYMAKVTLALLIAVFKREPDSTSTREAAA